MFKHFKYKWKTTCSNGIKQYIKDCQDCLQPITCTYYTNVLYQIRRKKVAAWIHSSDHLLLSKWGTEAFLSNIHASMSTFSFLFFLLQYIEAFIVNIHIMVKIIVLDKYWKLKPNGTILCCRQKYSKLFNMSQICVRLETTEQRPNTSMTCYYQLADIAKKLASRVYDQFNINSY